MRIIQINACYYWGSTGTIITDIQSACEEEGFDCQVVYAMPCHSKVVKGFKISTLFSRKLHALLNRITGKRAYYSIISTLLLIRFIRKYQPDIVHLHNVHNNCLNLKLLLRYLANYQIKTVITLHDCWFYTGGCFHYTLANCDRWLRGCGCCPQRHSIFDFSAKILADRIKYFSAIQNLYIVGVSRWITTQAKMTFFSNRPSMVIYNGVNMAVFRPMETGYRASRGWNGKQIILGPAQKWLSPINSQTLSFFLDHLKPNQLLVLFGCKSQKYSHPKVQLIDYIYDKNELSALYSSVDVMVNCTREESLSFINIEAQSCGTPVVTYDGTGVEETVNGICGHAVKSGDYEALFQKTMEVLENRPSVQECRKWVEDSFDKDKNYKQYVDYYKTIMHN